MMTLREFLEKVNFHEHYRIYQPNRDCLIFESYFKIHSPYNFDKNIKEPEDFWNKEYYEDNMFCNDVRECKEMDDETKAFLDKYGDYEVFSLECGGFMPANRIKGKWESVKIESGDFDKFPDGLPCFEVFIIHHKND